MLEIQTVITLSIFIITIILVMWRPKGINEAIPTIIGASVIILLEIVPMKDVYQILKLVSGPSITIISTIIMCIVLESIGAFKWAASNIIKKANGSGIRLFWYIIFLCFLMTIFFNNDGSILITTPIIIHIVTILKLKKHQKLPYLFGGVFVATTASLPIGVSNIANLIGLELVGLDLYSYTTMIFVPAMLGIITLSCLLFLCFKKDIPIKIATFSEAYEHMIVTYNNKNLRENHPLSLRINTPLAIDWPLFKVCILIVILIRSSYFILAPLNIHIEWIAIFGALLLITVRWFRKGTGISDVIEKAPWHILIFAFGMFVLVYALNNTQITSSLIELIRDPVTSNNLNASIVMGLLLTIMSMVMNNLPSVMLGTLMITEMGLDIHTLQVSYLAIIIGSDIGALITPMGTLATLLWMFVLKKNNIHVTWFHYFKVALLVIPISLMVTLLSLYFWIDWIIL